MILFLINFLEKCTKTMSDFNRLGLVCFAIRHAHRQIKAHLDSDSSIDPSFSFRRLKLIAGRVEADCFSKSLAAELYVSCTLSLSMSVHF